MFRNSLFLLLILLSGCSLGQRLLTVEVRVDDEVRFEGIRGVVDSTPVPEMGVASAPAMRLLLI